MPKASKRSFPADDFDLRQARRDLNKMTRMASKGQAQTAEMRIAVEADLQESERLIAKIDETLARR